MKPENEDMWENPEETCGAEKEIECLQNVISEATARLEELAEEDEENVEGGHTPMGYTKLRAIHDSSRDYTSNAYSTFWHLASYIAKGTVQAVEKWSSNASRITWKKGVGGWNAYRPQSFKGKTTFKVYSKSGRRWYYIFLTINWR